MKHKFSTKLIIAEQQVMLGYRVWGGRTEVQPGDRGGGDRLRQEEDARVCCLQGRVLTAQWVPRLLSTALPQNLPFF